MESNPKSSCKAIALWTCPPLSVSNFIVYRASTFKRCPCKGLPISPCRAWCLVLQSSSQTGEEPQRPDRTISNSSLGKVSPRSNPSCQVLHRECRWKWPQEGTSNGLFPAVGSQLLWQFLMLKFLLFLKFLFCAISEEKI